MKLIDVSTPKFPNTFAQVDDEDFEELNRHIWHIHHNKRWLYAVRHKSIGNSRQKRIRMHRYLLGLDCEKVFVDHINGDTLDNRKINLRVCTPAQNNMNQTKCRPNKTSKYKGVHWYIPTKKWVTQLRFKQKLIHLGYYTDEVKAAEAYDTAAKELFGNFAHCNFGAERNL